MIASTGTAAHAVVFIAQATASTRPARTSFPRLAQASARQVSAITGGSVTPSVSGKAISGDATEIAVSLPPGRGSPRSYPPRRPPVPPGGCPLEMSENIGPADPGPVGGYHRERRGERGDRDQRDPDPGVAKQLRKGPPSAAGRTGP